jgi:hypothetical protein
MKYNIVTNRKISDIFKYKSRYYRVNLGVVSTIESRSGDRTLNTLDDFAFFYNNMYRTTINGQGNIGNIFIYIDLYIKEDKIAFYFDKEEFIFDFDEKMVNEKGVDFYLGHLIKTIETEHQERLVKKQETIEEQKKEVGDPSRIFDNPGSVKYADLKAYMEKIRLERLKS